MNAEDYRAALKSRGFYFNESIGRWVGPYNVIVTGLLDYDLRPASDAVRDEFIATIDEHLRQKRCGPRPVSDGGPGPGLL